MEAMVSSARVDQDSENTKNRLEKWSTIPTQIIRGQGSYTKWIIQS